MAAVYLDASFPVAHHGLAVQDTHQVLILIEVVETSFEQFRRFAIHQNSQIIFFMDFRHLDKCLAAIDRQFGIGEVGRNHGGGTGVP